MVAVIQEQPLIHGEGTSASEWSRSVKLRNVEELGVRELVAGAPRVVIVAAHPDDEILGCGMLIAELVKHDIEVLVIAASDGEASHIGSRKWTAKTLMQARRAESEAAMRDVASNSNIVRLGLPDGRLAQHESELASCLQQLLLPGDLMVGHWRRDGHPDHEAVGRACARVSANLSHRFIEYPVWAWHWADPRANDLPWARSRRLAADDESIKRKRIAMSRFTSQITPDESTGAGPVIPETVLHRSAVVGEVFFV